MSLEKAIEYRKEKRKPYRGSKRVDRTCRNHGSCPHCEGNRTIQSKRELEDVTEQEDEFRKRECADEMVSGNLTNGKLVTVEEWNRLVDEQDELRARWMNAANEADLLLARSLALDYNHGRH